MSRPAKRPRTDHAGAAKHLRALPGTWQQVAVHATTSAAAKVARNIEAAYGLPAYEPAGAFQARTRPREFDTAVDARWLGAEHEARLLRAASSDTTDTTTRTGGA